MKEFVNAVKEQSEVLYKTGKLFVVQVEGSLFNHYLNSFPDGTNNKFRDPESSEHNCNTCHNFIRRYGNIVAIDENGNVITLFSNLNIGGEYKVVADKLDNILKNSPIVNVFFETYAELQSLPYEKCSKSNTVFRLGVAENYKQYTQEEVNKFGVVNAKDVYTFNHLHLDLPTAFVDKSGDSVERIRAKYRDKYSVFNRTMVEISLDTLELVRDLINQGSLRDGNAHLGVLNAIIDLKKAYDATTMNKSLWCWITTYEMSEGLAKFKNTLIGELCTELTEGMDLNKAWENWNKRVDPVNYHKVKSPITERQIKEAKKFAEENGYVESFNRRLATMDDIKASEILHINRDNNVKPVSIFDNVKSTSSQHKRSEFDKVEEVTIDKFMSDILPTCSSVELFLSGKNEANLVNLTTCVSDESKPIFKWNNNYSYTFNGNLAGTSQIKELVKSAGGKVDGVLRFSIMWSGDGSDNSDLDAHCVTPKNGHIYFSSKVDYQTGGNLDIDITQPLTQCVGKEAVENITFPSLTKMTDGTYRFYVHQFASRGSRGFKAEIEFNGESYFYSYDRAVSGDVDVAYVTLKDGKFTIEHKLPETNGSKEMWGLDTNKFHKVSLVCLTPNHWSEPVVGNKYYLFMLSGCKNPNPVRGFHNEHLIQDLLEHRKVMDVLGSSAMIAPSQEQLAGVGFNSTVRDEVVVRLSGTHKRIIKVKF